MSEQAEEGVGRPIVVDRVNVQLVKSAAESLENLVQRTGMKKVDIVNRALQIYDFFDAEMRLGSALVFRQSDGSEERVRIL